MLEFNWMIYAEDQYPEDTYETLVSKYHDNIQKHKYAFLDWYYKEQTQDPPIYDLERSLLMSGLSIEYVLDWVVFKLELSMVNDTYLSSRELVNFVDHLHILQETKEAS